jgi:hypothetical protein
MASGDKYPITGSFYGPNSDLSQRVVVLETNFTHHVADFSKYVGDLNVGFRELSKTVNELDKKVDLIVFQRDEADKKLSRWKNVGFAVLSAFAITLVGFLIKIALIVQGAHLPPVSP